MVLPLGKGANVFVRFSAEPSPSIDGGGWKLVRHVPAGNKWHPAKDQLRGTSTYGTPCGSLCNKAWSRKFDNMIFNEFLFATGDLKKWLVVRKDQVYGWYSNKRRKIEMSSINPKSYEAKWFRRHGNKEDPWISLTDHYDAIGKGLVVYGENGYGGNHASMVLPLGKGANVFVRFSADQKKCPIDRGYCVLNGHDQNSGVIKKNSKQGNSVAMQKKCLAICRAYPGATGCEVIWDQPNRGCYIHTQKVDRGNGVARHMCWVFSKCF